MEGEMVRWRDEEDREIEGIPEGTAKREKEREITEVRLREIQERDG